MAITPTQPMIDRLSRMVAPTAEPTLAQADLEDALVMYAMADANGIAPGGSGWLETYDLNGAAMECWLWKEAKASEYVSFTADGAQFSVSQITAHCQAKAAQYREARQTGNLTVGISS